jgi:hypothetical protein
MVLEPLFPKLARKGILYRCYRENGDIQLDIGTSYVKNYSFVKSKRNWISGSQMILPDITYVIYEDHWVKYKDTGRLSYFTRKVVEQFLNEIYTFREDHHVTEYK